MLSTYFRVTYCTLVSRARLHTLPRGSSRKTTNMNCQEHVAERSKCEKEMARCKGCRWPFGDDDLSLLYPTIELTYWRTLDRTVCHGKRKPMIRVSGGVESDRAWLALSANADSQPGWVAGTSLSQPLNNTFSNIPPPSTPWGPQSSTRRKMGRKRSPR